MQLKVLMIKLVKNKNKSAHDKAATISDWHDGNIIRFAFASSNILFKRIKTQASCIVHMYQLTHRDKVYASYIGDNFSQEIQKREISKKKFEEKIKTC